MINTANYQELKKALNGVIELDDKSIYTELVLSLKNACLSECVNNQANIKTLTSEEVKKAYDLLYDVFDIPKHAQYLKIIIVPGMPTEFIVEGLLIKRD